VTRRWVVFLFVFLGCTAENTEEAVPDYTGATEELREMYESVDKDTSYLIPEEER
jgi:hypothetical protein